MLLSSLSPDALNDLNLPAEALAALASHTEWEYTPDSVEGASSHAEWCDDCETWHQSWSVFGLRLDADGTLWSTQNTADTDGNWIFVEETPYTLEDAAYAADADIASRSWLDYAAHVAETGEDPLDNYWVAPRGPATRITRWRVTFGEEGGKVVVREARRGTRSYAPAQLPAPVREYLCLNEANEVAEVTTLEALAAIPNEVKWIRGGYGVGEICVQMPTVARPAEVRAAKRAAARRHLAEKRA
jgi:hypothetical protein